MIFGLTDVSCDACAPAIQGALEDDIAKYGAFQMKFLTDDAHLVPEKRNPYMLVPVMPNGMYFWYALNKCSGAVKNLGLSMGKKDESDYIRIPVKEYQMVIDAYERKLTSIEGKMHDLTGLEITLAMMSKYTHFNPSEQCFVSLVIHCHMPFK